MTVKIGKTNKQISKFGGNALVERVNEFFGIEKLALSFTPTLKYKSQLSKFKGLYYSLIGGADSLDDLQNHFNQDASFTSINEVHAPATYGRFLRDFTPEHLKKQRTALLAQAIRYRSRMYGFGKRMFLDIDSSQHQHYGRKIEGVGFGYAQVLALDSLSIFDENGICYFYDVRPGDTHTASGCYEAITTVVKAIKAQFPEIEIIVRADRGYPQNSFYQACYVTGVKFIVGAKLNQYNKFRGKICNWKGCWRETHKDGRDLEAGSYLYRPDDSPETLRLVLARAAIKDVNHYSMIEEDCFDYFGFFTNISESKIKNENIMRLYRLRGNSENFIREMKNGLELKTFPCQSLNANRAYAMIATMAHNTLRFLGSLIDPKHVPFAKRIRFLLIYKPCQVIQHARTTIFKFENKIYEEVMHRLKQITNIQVQYG